MRNEYDVVIAGGGMVGNTLACALGGTALRVAVIEPQPPSTPSDGYDQRVSAITPASQTVFENLGAWEGMRSRRISPVESMHVWEAASELHYDSADIGEPCLAWIIENRVIVTALRERLAGFPNLEIVAPASVAETGISDERVVVRLDHGRVLNARLVVGADGATSRVRESSGIGWTRHDLAQVAIVAVVRTQHPHGRCAFQHFLPTGPLAFLPLDDPHTVSIVWSADRARANQLLALDDVLFNAELQSAVGDRLGAVQLAGARAAFPLALGFAEHYTRHRVALVGDAAHTVHPLAGQGVNLGILDAATLADVLVDAASRGRDPGLHSRLRRYERSRKGADLGMQLVTGGFRYLFGSQWPGVQLARRTALQATERLPPLRDLFMRRASGLDGELPRLAQRVLR